MKDTFGNRDIDNKTAKEYKATEDEFYRSILLAQKILDVARTPMLILDMSMRVQLANDSFYHQFQTNENDTIGHQINAMGDGQWSIAGLDDLLEKVKSFSRKISGHQIQHKFDNIGQRILVLNISKIEYLQLIVLSIEDVTKVNRQEGKLSEIEARFNSMINQSMVGIYQADINGKYTFVNDRFCEITGRTREVLLEKEYIQSLTFPEDWPRNLELQENLFSKGESYIIEIRYVKPDNSHVWVMNYVNPMYNENGEVIGLSAGVIDVSEQKKSREAIKKSEEQYRTIFNSIDEGFCIMEILFDGNGNPVDYLFVDANPVFEEMTGLMQAKGKTALQLVPDLEKHWIEIYAKVALTGQPIRFIHEAKSMDDRWFDVFAFKLGEKESHKVALLFNNITERKKTEMALQQAKERAENAAKAKEDFLAHMSHEIRTPLNGVLGLTNLLLQQNPKAEQLENLRTLKFSAEILRALVNDILDFSKIQAGKVALQETDFVLSDFINNIFRAHHANAREKGLDFRLFIDKKIPAVILTDQLKLSQTLHNLLGNAVKFTKKGYIHLDVSFNKKEDNGQIWIDFSVTDTGIGISPDKIDHIFEVFTQEDSSTMRQFGGTGLGLTISKQLLELMGSRIHVDSQLREGSRFYFSLPVKQGNPSNISSGKEEADDEQEGMARLSILLVEDAEINRMVLKQFLSAWWKIIPDEALDGEQAIDMAAKKQYDLIMMDIRMPIMDGYQATQIIRKMPGYKKVPILALTADTAHELKKIPEYGLFNDLILKPVEPQDLRQKLVSYGAGLKVRSRHSTRQSQPVDLRKLNDLMKSNPESTKQFLGKVLVEFERIKKKFSDAMYHQDKADMDNIDHKAKMMLDLLNLKDLQHHFQDCKELLNSHPSEIATDKARVKGIDMLEHAIASLSQQLEKMP